MKRRADASHESRQAALKGDGQMQSVGGRSSDIRWRLLKGPVGFGFWWVDGKRSRAKKNRQAGSLSAGGVGWFKCGRRTGQ